MQNPFKLKAPETTQDLIGLVGGEPLDGSGFETEQTDLAYVANEITDTSDMEA